MQISDTSAQGGRVGLEGKGKLYYLHWLGLALYPVLVLAAPLPRCGAFLSVPASLPPLVFLTSEGRHIGCIKDEETSRPV